MYSVHIALVLICGAALLAVIVLLVLRRGLSEKYALLWLALALGVLISPLVYDLLGRLHEGYGWPTATAMLFFGGFILVLALLLQHSLAISRGMRERKRLGQRLALMEARLALLEGQAGAGVIGVEDSAVAARQNPGAGRQKEE